MREMILTYNELLLKLNELEEKVAGQDNKIKQIFYYLKQLIKDGEGIPRGKSLGLNNNPETKRPPRQHPVHPKILQILIQT